MPPPDAPVTRAQQHANRSTRRLAAGAVVGALAVLVAVGVPTGKAALLAVAPNLPLPTTAQPLRAPAHTCLTWQRQDATDAKAVSCTQPHLFEVTATLDLQDFGANEAFPDPARWQQLVSEDAPLRIVDRQCALVSAPLTQFDALLLSCATAAWRNIGLVAGDAKATQLRGGFQPAAYFLLHSRAQRLAETGALEWRGDLSSLPDCEVRLPPAAHAVRTPAATA